jgi:uncharacterized protein (TIGR00369 family)
MSDKVGVVPLEVLKTLSGLELMQGLIAGTYPRPPIMQALDFMLDRVEPGVAVFSGEAKYDHYNPIGTVHGGWIATLLDSCMGCAMHTTLKPGQGYTSLEIKVNFVRAVLDKTGRVTAEGRVIYAGSRTGTAEGKLLDANGKLLAHATTTCLIFPL